MNNRTKYTLTWDSSRTRPGAPWKTAAETSWLPKALLIFTFMVIARRDVSVRLTREAL